MLVHSKSMIITEKRAGDFSSRPEINHQGGTMHLTRRSFIRVSCAFIGLWALNAKEAAAGFISMPSQKHPKIMFYVV